MSMAKRLIPETLRKRLIREVDLLAGRQQLADGVWPEVIGRPRLHAVAEFVDATTGMGDYAEGRAAALAVCHHLAIQRPEEVTDAVAAVLALGPGKRAMMDVEGVPAYFTFCPRPDAVHDFDQQTGFAESDTNGVIFCLGGNGSGTTTCVLAKAVRFMLENPAPRKNCPFWLIAGSYEQTMSLFDEKLDQKGHLPMYAVDTGRISWYRPNNNWPYRVPLLPDRDGNNWVLEFKSYEQGRQQMQARSVGGFAFIEQFPWELLTEVLRGCREPWAKRFVGNKLAEFTPIDPTMSATLEEMIRFGKAPADITKRTRGAKYLPDNWEVFYCNTAVAAEAGNVDPDWFAEFSAMIPDDMLDVRLRGMFASFEGLIYKGLNPAVHFVSDDIWGMIPADAVHYRSIDWGSGPENPFCCLWGLRDRRRPVWFIHDEEYDNDQGKTTIDHLCDVYRKHPWKEGNQMYGRTYADPSGVDNIRLAQKLPQYVDDPTIEQISISMAYNAVLEGIEHVQYLLKPNRKVIDPTDPTKILQVPRLFIHEQNCPNLCRELRSYRWKKSTGAGANPADAKPEPLKKADHACDALRYMTMTTDRQENCDIETASHQGTAADLIRRDRNRGGWRRTLGR